MLMKLKMQEKQLFEYAIIRIMPRVEREEFINAGVILYCAKQKFLKVVYTINRNKLLALDAQLDIDFVAQNIEAFAKIAEGGANAGPIGLFDAASRFRWLTATRSTVVQCSKVHPGFCSNADDMLAAVMQKMVL